MMASRASEAKGARCIARMAGARTSNGTTREDTPTARYRGIHYTTIPPPPATPLPTHNSCSFFSNRHPHFCDS